MSRTRFTKFLFSGLLFSLLLLSAPVFSQQPLTFPRASPQAEVSQTIGFSEIEINYSRPAVNGRKIWGALVPYGLTNFGFGAGNPAPWRAGANENTTISITDDCRIEGKLLKAGTYGLHIIVNPDEWTFVFNRQFQAWGSFFYDKSEDELRVSVKPEEAEFVERLIYGFDNITNRSTRAYIHWEKMKAGFNIEFDVHAIVLENFRDQLSGLAGFGHIGFGQAANYCFQNNVNLDEAMIWIDKALTLNGGPNFNYLNTKSGLLNLQDKNKEAEEALEQAFEIATEAELNTYGYQLMNNGNMEKALEIFSTNLKRHPESWNAHDSLAEANKNAGNTDKAKKLYQKAHDLAPEAQKARIKGILDTL
ncbi:MAG: DUF2911 domain-containing protein [Melioribacteraceae bacterium]|nr:DUF2911 domain-containing protein [Melioribacteraceae bacterium]MCF8432059.1 DUF2911 domain-containing protein [Melioribacteraceae bacterium]